jgi:hypothetical protein
METRANALYSPGGTLTFPDCEVPGGLVGAKRAAITASCNPLDVLEIVQPAACAFAVANSSVPGCPSPAHVPPVTLTGSASAALLLPGPSIRSQYSGSRPLTPAGQDCKWTILLPA